MAREAVVGRRLGVRAAALAVPLALGLVVAPVLLLGDAGWRGRGLFAEVFTVTADLLHRRFGIQRVLLGVDRENAAALAAYERSGFRNVVRPGTGSVWMECRLA